MRVEINDYIVSDSEICGGTPTFKGSRVMVWQVLELLGAGVKIEEIRRDYFPHISKEAILSVFNFTSKLISEEYAR
jgi:uncharacterized protein (DUF433 family)